MSVLCSTSSSGFGVVSVLDLGQSHRYLTLFCFNLHFPDIWCSASFHILFGHMYIFFGIYIFFGEVSVMVFNPFFLKIRLLLPYCWIWVLCILHNSYQMYLIQLFSPNLWLVFCSKKDNSKRDKFLFLMSLLVVFLVTLTWVLYLKIDNIPRSSRFSPLCSLAGIL